MSPTIDGSMYTPAFPAWIALDMGDFDAALALVGLLAPYVEGFKVHASAENDLARKVKLLRKAGAKKLWWDRKAKDVAFTVAGIARTAVKCGFGRMTVHAAGGIEMMMAAVEHGPEEIVAITDLTSLSEAEIGMLSGMPKDSSTLLKAHWAKLAGVSHIVCSCEEVGMLHERRKHSKVSNRPLELHGIGLVVPGSRTVTDDMGSQKRSTTAMEALERGADELVLGSEVWGSPPPRETLFEINRKVSSSRRA